jgi:hypothetical protein
VFKVAGGNTQLGERRSLLLDAPAQYAPADSTDFLDQASLASEKIELFMVRGLEDVHSLE